MLSPDNNRYAEFHVVSYSPLWLASFIRPSIKSSRSSIPRFLSINWSSVGVTMPSWSLSRRSNAVRKSSKRCWWREEEKKCFVNICINVVETRCVVGKVDDWQTVYIQIGLTIESIIMVIWCLWREEVEPIIGSTSIEKNIQKKRKNALETIHIYTLISRFSVSHMLSKRRRRRPGRSKNLIVITF